MAREEDQQDLYNQEDHQVAYIFDPDNEAPRHDRPSKRRRVSKAKTTASEFTEVQSSFLPLFNGTEKIECVQLRKKLFQDSWDMINGRIQDILKGSNRATLDQVSDFVDEAKVECGDQVPSAFIITGPNIASQDLLFEQLSETLQNSTPSKFIRLRSSQASALKATLKKIIRDVTAKTTDDDNDDLQVGGDQDGRRYLDYDLEALYAFIQPQKCEHVFVAFQDSEGFESGLLSELIVLFNSWRPRIPFTLLFGIATSVELLQARLLKSACQLVYGAQFDVIQTETILEMIFKSAIAAVDVPIRLGAPLLRQMLDRQRDQVAGVQIFIMSLKYAYMCHFYANPLSVLLSPQIQDGTLQAEHLEAIRNVGSFRDHIEQAIESGRPEHLDHARSLLEDDTYLQSQIQGNFGDRHQWINDLLRSLLIVAATGAQDGEFSRAYVDAMEHGLTITEQSSVADAVRRMDTTELSDFLSTVISILSSGDQDLRLDASTNEEDLKMRSALEQCLEGLETLKAEAERQGITLRSKYSGQSKVLRTTVIAQRVQLSQDSAALTEEDKKLTLVVDEAVKVLASRVYATSASSVVLSEAWLYDSRSPARDVFVPRPRAVLERSLARPHDYLSCSCCKHGEDGVQATMPATSILYHLYMETGNLINVADLWAAFTALVGETEQDERETLVMFYRGMAELRALGFVKASKKKVDHIAKLKWL